MNDNLPELRDIHIPDGVSIFPPAYGWYIILLFICLLFCAFKLYKLWKQKSRKLYALKMLADLQNSEIVSSATKISELLRRICVYRYPQAVSLNGKAWIDFLYSHTKNTLSPLTEELLLNAPYIHSSNHNYKEDNFSELQNFARIWIGENL